MQGLRQVTKSVVEYYQEIETMMESGNIREEEEDTMSRFLGGLNRDDMNPTTDHFHVLERAITKSNTKKIQVSNQENSRVADIGKWLEDLSLLELPIKTIYEYLIFFNLYLISFISDL